MPSLIERVARTIRRFDLLQPGARVAVAVSGGSDSIALLHILLELRSALRLGVAGMVHVNHQLRGGDADRDEAFCTALADRLELPIVVERVDVRTRAARERTSIENAGRIVRLEVFDRAARELEATVCWMSERPAPSGARLAIKQTTRWSRAILDEVISVLDIETLEQLPAGGLSLNDLARVRLRLASPLLVDPYAVNRQTGAFVLVDEATNETVGAGMVVTASP